MAAAVAAAAAAAAGRSRTKVLRDLSCLKAPPPARLLGASSFWERWSTESSGWHLGLSSGREETMQVWPSSRARWSLAAAVAVAGLGVGAALATAGELWWLGTAGGLGGPLLYWLTMRRYVRRRRLIREPFPEPSPRRLRWWCTTRLRRQEPRGDLRRGRRGLLRTPASPEKTRSRAVRGDVGVFPPGSGVHRGSNVSETATRPRMRVWVRRRPRRRLHHAPRRLRPWHHPRND